MFKKNVSVQTSRPLSGKDSKQLRRDIQVHYPDLSEEDIKELFPAKAEVSVRKLNNKAVAYAVDGVDLFFSPDGHGDALLPTVYCLWKTPHMLPALFTYSEVSPKVLGGADLFLQGLIVPEQGLGDFASGDLRVIRIPQNQFPFAIGSMEVSSESVAKNGLKGKGLKLIHHYPDQLWSLGPKSVPDASFTPTRIFPQVETQPIATKPEDVNVESLSLAESSENGKTRPINSMQEGVPDIQQSTEAGNGTARHESAVGGCTSGAPLTGDSASVEAANAAGESQDSLAEAALMTGLHSVMDKELPMLISEFWAKHMKPAAPALDIKRTSYKKLSKLLQKYEKLGLLKLKVVHKQDNLSFVDRSHSLFGKHEPISIPSTSGGEGDSGSNLSITSCYRVPSSLKPLFTAAATSKDDLLTEDQIRDALTSYAAANRLSCEWGGEPCLRLDKVLHANLFNKKEAVLEGNPHPASNVFHRLLGKVQLYHRVVRTEQGVPVEVVKKGAIKPIKIDLEDRQGGRKHITRVAHVESFALDPDAFAGVLQRKFQTSAAVQKLPGKTESGKEISLQGDLLQKIASYLTSEYGIDAKYIDVSSRLKAKG